MIVEEGYDMPLLSNGVPENARWARKTTSTKLPSSYRRLLFRLLLALCIALSAVSSVKRYLATDTDRSGGTTRRFEDSVLLTLKTGSGVLYNRSPIQLMHLSNSRGRPSVEEQWYEYIPNQLVYSDAEECIAGVQVIDALKGLPKSVHTRDEYLRLKALLANNQDPSVSSKRGSGSPGWDLDKWKFLELHADAAKRFPTIKYTVSIEADTFVFWNQIIKWLQVQESTDINGADEPKMWGNGLLLNDISFAHGGSGYVSSRGLVQQTFGSDPLYQQNATFLEMVDGSCCGDAVLAHTFQMRLPHWRPSYDDSASYFNGEPPALFKFAPDEWCNPIFTLHGITPFDYVQLDKFKRTVEPLINGTDYIRRADLWDAMSPAFLRLDPSPSSGRASSWPPVRVTDGLVVTVQGWRGVPQGEGELQDNTSTASQCEMRCREANPESCLMWTFDVTSHECFHSSSLYIGRAADNFFTGYEKRRIDAMRGQHSCIGRLGNIRQLMNNITHS